MAEKMRQSMSILLSTTFDLSTRARALEDEVARNRRAVRARDRVIAELQERARLADVLLHLASRHQAVRDELGTLEEKLHNAAENAARWEQQVVRVRQDCVQWKSLYEVRRNEVRFTSSVYDDRKRRYTIKSCGKTLRL
ncbi:hypothetical protein GGX14DRAFT_542953 [Mycena pura]|uniref:Uncharacterized protein n=1 Tax=Mycena pura TaxID=153505 RepID=A0AAD6YAK7_9AGAR|nr:hypothetical protein GGX14DRAFT_542953 [Mycena pura]